MTIHLRKVTAAAVSLIFVSQSTYLLHAAESNFWESRRAASAAAPQASKKQAPALPAAQLASASSLTPSLSVPLTQNALTGLGLSGELNLGPNVAAAQKKIPAWIQSSIAPFGGIISVEEPAKKQSGLVVLFQDAHLHAEAQKNLKGALGALARNTLKQTNPGLVVGLEGGSRVADYSPYFETSYQHGLSQMVSIFLNKNILTGPEAALMTFDPKSHGGEAPFTVMGVETQADYDANVQALRDSEPLKEKALASLSALDQVLVELKREYYDSRLFAHDAKLEGFEKGTLSVPEYVLYLDSLHTATGPQSRTLIEAALLEGSIDFNRVERERAVVLEQLVRKMSESEVEHLFQISRLYKAGQISYSGYYDVLKKVSKAKGVDFSRYPELNLYIQYVLKSENIEASALFTELASLEKKVQEKLFEKKEARLVAGLTRDLHRVSKLIRHELIEDEWMDLTDRREEVFNFTRRLNALGKKAPEPLLAMNGQWGPFEDFYSAAMKRNESIASNLLARMKKDKASVGVLVAGGFHTQGLVSELKKNGIMVAVAAPKITTTEQGLSSLDFLAKNVTPLDELFAGNRLFLSLPAVTVNPASAQIQPLLLTGAAAWDVNQIQADSRGLIAAVKLEPGASAEDKARARNDLSGWVSGQPQFEEMESEEGAVVIIARGEGVAAGEANLENSSLRGASSIILRSPGFLGSAIFGLILASQVSSQGVFSEISHLLLSYEAGVAAAAFILFLAVLAIVYRMHKPRPISRSTERPDFGPSPREKQPLSIRLEEAIDFVSGVGSPTEGVKLTGLSSELLQAYMLSRKGGEQSEGQKFYLDTVAAVLDAIDTGREKAAAEGEASVEKFKSRLLKQVLSVDLGVLRKNAVANGVELAGLAPLRQKIEGKLGRVLDVLEEEETQKLPAKKTLLVAKPIKPKPPGNEKNLLDEADSVQEDGSVISTVVGDKDLFGPEEASDSTVVGKEDLFDSGPEITTLNLGVTPNENAGDLIINGLDILDDDSDPNDSDSDITVRSPAILGTGLFAALLAADNATAVSSFFHSTSAGFVVGFVLAAAIGTRLYFSDDLTRKADPAFWSGAAGFGLAGLGTAAYLGAAEIHSLFFATGAVLGFTLTLAGGTILGIVINHFFQKWRHARFVKKMVAEGKMTLNGETGDYEYTEGNQPWIWAAAPLVLASETNSFGDLFNTPVGATVIGLLLSVSWLFVLTKHGNTEEEIRQGIFRGEFWATIASMVIGSVAFSFILGATVSFEQAGLASLAFYTFAATVFISLFGVVFAVVLAPFFEPMFVKASDPMPDGDRRRVEPPETAREAFPRTPEVSIELPENVTAGENEISRDPLNVGGALQYLNNKLKEGKVSLLVPVTPSPSAYLIRKNEGQQQREARPIFSGKQGSFIEIPIHYLKKGIETRLFHIIRIHGKNEIERFEGFGITITDDFFDRAGLTREASDFDIALALVNEIDRGKPPLKKMTQLDTAAYAEGAASATDSLNVYVDPILMDAEAERFFSLPREVILTAVEAGLILGVARELGDDSAAESGQTLVLTDRFFKYARVLRNGNDEELEFEMEKLLDDQRDTAEVWEGAEPPVYFQKGPLSKNVLLSDLSLVRAEEDAPSPVSAPTLDGGIGETAPAPFIAEGMSVVPSEFRQRGQFSPEIAQTLADDMSSSRLPLLGLDKGKVRVYIKPTTPTDVVKGQFHDLDRDIVKSYLGTLIFGANIEGHIHLFFGREEDASRPLDSSVVESIRQESLKESSVKQNARGDLKAEVDKAKRAVPLHALNQGHQIAIASRLTVQTAEDGKKAVVFVFENTDAENGFYAPLSDLLAFLGEGVRAYGKEGNIILAFDPQTEEQAAAIEEFKTNSASTIQEWGIDLPAEVPALPLTELRFILSGNFFPALLFGLPLAAENMTESLMSPFGALALAISVPLLIGVGYYLWLDLNHSKENRKESTLPGVIMILLFGHVALLGFAAATASWNPISMASFVSIFFVSMLTLLMIDAVLISFRSVIFDGREGIQDNWYSISPENKNEFNSALDALKVKTENGEEWVYVFFSAENSSGQWVKADSFNETVPGAKIMKSRVSEPSFATIDLSAFPTHHDNQMQNEARHRSAETHDDLILSLQASYQNLKERNKQAMAELEGKEPSNPYAAQIQNNFPALLFALPFAVDNWGSILGSFTAGILLTVAVIVAFYLFKRSSGRTQGLVEPVSIEQEEAVPAETGRAVVEEQGESIVSRPTSKPLTVEDQIREDAEDGKILVVSDESKREDQTGLVNIIGEISVELALELADNLKYVANEGVWIIQAETDGRRRQVIAKIRGIVEEPLETEAFKKEKPQTHLPVSSFKVVGIEGAGQARERVYVPVIIPGFDGDPFQLDSIALQYALDQKIIVSIVSGEGKDVFVLNVGDSKAESRQQALQDLADIKTMVQRMEEKLQQESLGAPKKSSSNNEERRGSSGINRGLLGLISLGLVGFGSNLEAGEAVSSLPVVGAGSVSYYEYGFIAIAVAASLYVAIRILSGLFKSASPDSLQGGTQAATGLAASGFEGNQAARQIASPDPDDRTQLMVTVYPALIVPGTGQRNDPAARFPLQVVEQAVEDGLLTGVVTGEGADIPTHVYVNTENGAPVRETLETLRLRTIQFQTARQLESQYRPGAQEGDQGNLTARARLTRSGFFGGVILYFSAGSSIAGEQAIQDGAVSALTPSYLTALGVLAAAALIVLGAATFMDYRRKQGPKWVRVIGEVKAEDGSQPKAFSDEWIAALTFDQLSELPEDFGPLSTPIYDRYGDEISFGFFKSRLEEATFNTLSPGEMHLIYQGEKTWNDFLDEFSEDEEQVMKNLTARQAQLLRFLVRQKIIQSLVADPGTKVFWKNGNRFDPGHGLPHHFNSPALLFAGVGSLSSLLSGSADSLGAATHQVSLSGTHAVIGLVSLWAIFGAAALAMNFFKKQDTPAVKESPDNLKRQYELLARAFSLSHNDRLQDLLKSRPRGYLSYRGEWMTESLNPVDALQTGAFNDLDAKQKEEEFNRLVDLDRFLYENADVVFDTVEAQFKALTTDDLDTRLHGLFDTRTDEDLALLEKASLAALNAQEGKGIVVNVLASEAEIEAVAALYPESIGRANSKGLIRFVDLPDFSQSELNQDATRAIRNLIEQATAAGSIYGVAVYSSQTLQVNTDELKADFGQILIDLILLTPIQVGTLDNIGNQLIALKHA